MLTLVKFAVLFEFENFVSNFKWSLNTFSFFRQLKIADTNSDIQKERVKLANLHSAHCQLFPLLGSADGFDLLQDPGSLAQTYKTFEENLKPDTEAKAKADKKASNARCVRII